MLGRMISPDTVVPDALNSQSWNRYSYVGNDPLTFTDPTGHSWLSNFFGAIFGALKSLFNIPIIRAIATIALSIILTPAFAAALGAIAGGAAAAGIASAAVTGLAGGRIGDILKAGLIAGVTALAFDAVGTATSAHGMTLSNLDPAKYLANVAGHAGVGCLSAVASGGQCGPAALSAAAGAAAAPFIAENFHDPVHNPADRFGGTAVSAVVGGLASVAGGGKFENGAVTAAFGYLFNQAAMALCATGPAGCAAGLGITAGQLLGRVALVGGAIVLNSDSSQIPKPEGIPDDWIEKPTEGKGGTEWVNPDNTNDRVRVMPGNPDSPNPPQQKPYVVDQNGGYRDVNGNPIPGARPGQTPEAHIPYEDFRFRR